jgi:hypothetical protein
MKGIQIKTLKMLERFALGKKAVTCFINHGKPIPAMVMFNMPGSIIQRNLVGGMWLYLKPTPKKHQPFRFGRWKCHMSDICNDPKPHKHCRECGQKGHVASECAEVLG